jgi:hypothetical protein
MRPPEDPRVAQWMPGAAETFRPGPPHLEHGKEVTCPTQRTRLRRPPGRRLKRRRDEAEFFRRKVEEGRQIGEKLLMKGEEYRKHDEEARKHG